MTKEEKQIIIDLGMKAYQHSVYWKNLSEFGTCTKAFRKYAKKAYRQSTERYHTLLTVAIELGFYSEFEAALFFEND